MKREFDIDGPFGHSTGSSIRQTLPDAVRDVVRSYCESTWTDAGDVEEYPDTIHVTVTKGPGKGKSFSVEVGVEIEPRFNVETPVEVEP